MYLILLSILLSFSPSSKDKRYTFDHFLHYEYQYSAGMEMEDRFFLTNSKDNSYFADLRIANDDSLEVRFLHHDKLMAFFKVHGSSIIEKDRFEMFCKNLSNAENHFKYRTREYSFYHFSDTILKTFPGDFYMIKNNSIKSEKKYGLVRRWMNQKPGTRNHFPLLIHPTIYEEWKKEKSALRGVAKLRFDEYLEDPIERNIYKLKNIIPVKKIFIYSQNCSTAYQKKEVYLKYYNIKTSKLPD